MVLENYKLLNIFTKEIFSMEKNRVRLSFLKKGSGVIKFKNGDEYRGTFSEDYVNGEGRY